MMNADGTGQVNITNGPDLMPDWGPIPTAPQRSNYKNAAEFCKAERDFLGESGLRGQVRNQPQPCQLLRELR